MRAWLRFAPIELRGEGGRRAIEPRVRRRVVPSPRFRPQELRRLALHMYRPIVSISPRRLDLISRPAGASV